MGITVSVIINRMAEKNLNGSRKQKVAQIKSMSVRATRSPLPLNPTGGEIDRQRNVCRVKTRDGSYGGYKKDILTENLSDRDNEFLVCGICRGIMREACLNTSSGEQFCSCCEVRDPNSQIKRTNTFTKRNPSKQTPNVAVRKMVDSLKCSCPLIERGCKWLGTLKDCEDHLDTCGYVHALCKLKCGIVIQRNELKLHEEKKCLLLIAECKHCKGEMKLGDMSIHLGVCPKMEVSCELRCGVVVCREDMTQHFNKDCGLVEESCKLGCGAKIKRIGLKFHEEKKCPFSITECEHCKGELKLGDMSTHLGVCPKMEVSCELRCGVVICREDVTQHLKKECGMVGVKCLLGCEVKMTRNELKTHVTETCVRRNVPCEHCKKDFRFCNLTHHLDKCPKMKVSCELKCGKIMCREDMEQHLMQECGLVKEVCKLGCKTKLTRNELMIHVTETCEQRFIPCEHCVEIVKCCDMTHHLETCPKMKVSCELKCGVVMCREKITHHLKQDCGLVKTSCKLGCGAKITRNELQTHVVDVCMWRNVSCEHCKKDLKFGDMTHHLKVCPKMEVLCELKCGEVMCREKMTHHLKQDCGLVEESCKLGCGAQSTRNELKIHVTETCQQRLVQCEHCEESVKSCEMTNHPDVCPKMEVSCELTCGASMCREDMAQHLGKHCPEKEVECPFAKYNCEVTSIKRQHLDAHMDKNKLEHMELKLNGLENIVKEQGIEIKQMLLEKKRTEHPELTPNGLEDTIIHQEGEKNCIVTINRLSEQINTLCSLNSTAKLEWNIKDIRFMQIFDRQERQVGEFTLNVYFERNSIRVSFNNEQESYQTAVVAKFMISLYSNTKMRVIKQYKHDISQFLIGGVKQEISCISNSDVEEFSRIGATNDITLEMYVTVL